MTLTQKTFSPAMQRRLRQGAAEIASLDDDIDQLIRLAEIARSVRDELSATMAPRERGFLVLDLVSFLANEVSAIRPEFSLVQRWPVSLEFLDRPAAAPKPLHDLSGGP